MFDLRLTPEQLAIRDAVREFAARELSPVALELDRQETFEARYPRELARRASRELGLRTVALSPQHGGAGADTLTCTLVIEELAVGDAGFAATLGQTLTFAQLWFDRLMTPEQVERFLPDFLADHDYQLAFAGHEPDTDLGWSYHEPWLAHSGHKTTARRVGSQGWVLNGIKNYITNGGIARLYAVLARTDPERPGPAGLSTFLVPADTPGFTRHEHDKVGRRLGSNAELHFDDCFVPAENLLGQEGRPTTEGASWGRGGPRFQAVNLGIGRAAYQAALEYASLRVQGGKPIVQHQAVGLDLARMAVDLEAARALVWQAAWAADHPPAYADRSLPDLPLQAVAKLYTSEAVYRVVLTAIQLFGGLGVMRDVPLQKYLRDALIFLHSEHSNDVARLRLAETLLGFQRERPSG